MYCAVTAFVLEADTNWTNLISKTTEFQNWKLKKTTYGYYTFIGCIVYVDLCNAHCSLLRDNVVDDACRHTSYTNDVHIRLRTSRLYRRVVAIWKMSDRVIAQAVSPPSHCGGPVTIPGWSIWDLCLIEWHWNHFYRVVRSFLVTSMPQLLYTRSFVTYAVWGEWVTDRGV